MATNQFNRRYIWKAMISVLLCTTGLGTALAQTYPYTVDFETTGSKPYAATTPVTIDNIDWTMPGVYLGYMVTPPGDFFNDNKAARMRRTENETGDPGSMTMLGDLTEGIGEISFHTAMYGNETGGRLVVMYSTDQGDSWVQAGDTIEVPVNASPLVVTRMIAQTGNVRISIRKAELTSARINIDDIVMTDFELRITALNPTGVEVPLSTDALSISFDEAVEAATGTISLYTTGGDVLEYNVPDDVVISDSTVTVPGISLANATAYYVQLSEAAFTNADSTLFSPGILDDTSWTFSTVDTTSLPPFTSLDETFADCGNGSMGLFTQYSTTGSSVWHCANFGHNDSTAVEINGGAANGISEANEDWLISVAPFDLSQMNQPALSLWQKRRFDGEVHRSIRISTDYAGIGDPELATWTALQIAALAQAPPLDEWSLLDAIDLADYKTMPFYLAFTYACADSGAYALAYDDIRIEEATGISSRSRGNLGVFVLGQPTTHSIRLQVMVPQATRLHFSLFDLSGRQVYAYTYPAVAGKNEFTLQPGALQSGMYLIHIRGGQQYGTVKAVIQ